MTTIQDVARLADVSAATVSRVLNGLTTVSPDLAERVNEAVRELDYRPNAVARNLRRSRTSLWAVIVADVGNPFFTAVVRGIEDVAQSGGYSVVLCNSDEDPVKEDLYLSVAVAEQMAGVIISSSGRSRRIQSLVDGGTPVVAIDRRLPQADVDTVLVDNERRAELATQHLIDSGYRQIACITGPKRVTTAAERLRGYQRGLKAGGMRYDETLVGVADFREQGGYLAMSSLLERQPRPDAVFVANNLMTVGAPGAAIADHGRAAHVRIGAYGGAADGGTDRGAIPPAIGGAPSDDVAGPCQLTARPDAGWAQGRVSESNRLAHQPACAAGMNGTGLTCRLGSSAPEQSFQAKFCLRPARRSACWPECAQWLGRAH